MGLLRGLKTDRDRYLALREEELRRGLGHLRNGAASG